MAAECAELIGSVVWVRTTSNPQRLMGRDKPQFLQRELQEVVAAGVGAYFFFSNLSAAELMQ
jgi:hypothetical protein